MEREELAGLGVHRLGAEVKARGMAWYHLPVGDFQAPGEAFAEPWAGARPALLEHLGMGGKILIHCKGGQGRSGTIAALLLIGCGHRPAEAIRIVRRTRPGAIETRGRSPGFSPEAVGPTSGARESHRGRSETHGREAGSGLTALCSREA